MIKDWKPRTLEEKLEMEGRRFRERLLNISKAYDKVDGNLMKIYKSSRGIDDLARCERVRQEEKALRYHFEELIGIYEEEDERIYDEENEK